MNEPFTMSRPGISFSGKTYNNRPQWCNEPLRLTEEQMHDPILVLTDFFQYYHLKDTREILWDWLTEVISSTRRLSSDPHDRGNQLYFYERIEELIEAALLISRSLNSIKSDESNPSIIDHNEGDKEILCKPKHLIEYVEREPIYVLKKVFNPDDEFIIGEVKEWLKVGLSAESTVYDDCEQRRNLISFHDHLIMLIEALFVITLKNVDNAELKQTLSATYSLTELSTFQANDPEKVIVDFFEKYPIKYITRELDDWYEASLSFTGEWLGNVICLQQVWNIYRKVQCLIKSAELLLKHPSVKASGM